jgi:hypothetical protein
MRLPEDEARARLAAHDHGVLCTVHPERGIDAVPVVYAVDDEGYVGVPIDRVKPKTSSRLQRERNLEADPRGTLLVEHWDRHDWSQLWWVRAELRLQDDVAGRAGAAHRRRDRLGRGGRMRSGALGGWARGRTWRRVRLVQREEEE